MEGGKRRPNAPCVRGRKVFPEHGSRRVQQKSGGARLKHVAGVNTAGQEIWIKRHNSKARYRVLWIGQPETPEAGQFAAECLEETVIWENEVSSRLR